MAATTENSTNINSTKDVGMPLTKQTDVGASYFRLGCCQGAKAHLQQRGALCYPGAGCQITEHGLQLAGALARGYAHCGD
jgi:hypothetical protein